MSKLLRQEQCPQCMDSGKDNLAVYDDGEYCFGCGYSGGKQVKVNMQFLEGTCKDLPARAISKRTAEFWGYKIGERNGELVHIANYLDSSGRVVAQKIRNHKKEFLKIGGTIKGLYGQWLHKAKDTVSLVITEGELDALSITEAMGTQYPVVSLPNGASGAVKSISESLDWVSGFKDIVLCFDNDEAGISAADKVTSLLPVGKVRRARLPLKDANEMLKAGKSNELKQAIWNAPLVTPSTVVRLDNEEFINKVLESPKFGIDFPWRAMTDITYGLRERELYVVAAATSVGKTEFVRELISHMISQKINVGIFSFEQDAASTIRRIIGGYENKKLHLPGISSDKDVTLKYIDQIKDYISLYNNRGGLTLEEVCANIRYMAKAFDTKFFVIDNLKSLLSMKQKGTSDNDYLARCTGEMVSLIHELNINIVVLTHVAKDKVALSTYVSNKEEEEDKKDKLNKPGMSWDSGRMPVTENIYGPGVLTDLADYVFALARNKVSEDPEEQRVTRVKCLKSRLDGSKTGKEFKLYYSDEGRLVEMF